MDALDEIAFLLERERSSTYRVQAFRTAGAAVAGIDDLARVRGRLTRIPGVGDRSAEVISQALDGEVPRYLADLRARHTGPLAPGGEEVRAVLLGDLHTHSDWSDGGSPIDVMARTARRLGHRYMALTDHSPRLTVANGLTAERLVEQLDVVAEVDESLADFTLLSGIEVDINEDGTLDQAPELLARLDVVVASVHSKLRMDRIGMTRRMLTAVRDRSTNVLGHCTGRLVEGSRGKRPQSQFDAKRVFAACAENDVAVEINARPERRDPPDQLIELALEAGCLFSIDSDAHAPGQLDFLDHGAARVQQLGVPLDRVVTTWPLDRLLAWSHAKR